MNKMNTEKLTRIKAALQQYLLAAGRATDGKWVSDQSLVYPASESNPVVCDCIEYGSEQDSWNATFIALSRNLSPWMAKALLATIETLEKNSRHCDGASHDHNADILTARASLSALIESMPEDLL